MTVTLGTKALKCTGIGEPGFDLAAAQWDAWENGAYKRKHRVYGLIRKWSLDCIEENVAWNDSSAKYLREQAATGSVLNYSVDEGNRYTVPATNVYVLNVSLRLALVGSKNIRHFTVTVREA